jgi:hypothetical protein
LVFEEENEMEAMVIVAGVVGAVSPVEGLEVRVVEAARKALQEKRAELVSALSQVEQALVELGKKGEAADADA